MTSGAATIRVLNVEDYAPARYARSKILREAGFDVAEAPTGQEALSLVVALRPHLVVLDMNLPDLGGSEVCRRIKSDPRTALVQVLHVSASYRDGDDYARALDQGADGYLTEPIEPRVLVATVRALARARRAEQAVEAAARHWQMTFDAITDGVCLLDRAGRVVRYNPVFARLAGLDSALAGRPGIEVFQTLTGRPEGALPEMFAASGRMVTEVEAGGRWLQIARDPVLGEGGELEGAVCIVTDISERKRVEKMTAELLDAEKVARVGAEAANRAKDEFLAILSHELRTPLTAILGWVGMLATRRLDAETTERAVQVVTRNARLQVQLVDELLDVSRMISGKMSLTLAAVDLARTLEASIDALRGAAADKQVDVELRVEGDPVPVSGDASRLQQVFTNVLSNAVKFTLPQGRVTVSIAFGHDVARVAVQDTGQGIDPAFLPHLFEPFRQAEAAGRRARMGLGLGLAIARHLVELHGGMIEAASDGLGHGATITVTLPVDLTTSTAVTTAPAASEGQGPRGTIGPLAGFRIVLVEDEPDTRDALVLMLGDAGAQVVALDTVRSALDVIRAQPPDVLISDIGMPDEDGYDLIRAVRGLAPERGGATPAIAVTAFARGTDHEQALSAGYDRHLAKPVERDSLTAVVAELLGAALSRDLRR
jgi:PAS domain S-box-containing protein